MLQNRISSRYIYTISLIGLFFCGFSSHIFAQQAKVSVSVHQTDSIAKNVQKDSIKSPTTDNPIDAQIEAIAMDSMVLFSNGEAFLYGNTDIKYKEMNLSKADFVKIRMDSALVYAYPQKDSIGNMVGKPIFKDENSQYEADAITYNFKSKKGYVRQAVTQQGDGYIISRDTKILADKTINILNGKYTTCENNIDPHFYLNLTKGKARPGENVVSGPAYMVLLDVPLPLAIPFGFFPFNTKYSSGIEMPSFNTDYTRGYSLNNGGYYFAFNDYLDLSIKGDIYTRGTWGVNAISTYLKRYKFNGGVSISYREDVTGEKDMPDYSKAKNLSIRWTHTQNSKANPYRNFSAGVNFSTSGYNRSNINSYYSPVNANNTTSSSISFSQRFPNSPFSFTANIGVVQRNQDSTINLTLPNLSINMSRIYPFKRKKRAGKNEHWYEKISMSYSGNISNSITTKESKLLQSSLANDWKNGMSHSIPISASFRVFDYITITPSINYKERWYLSSVEKHWDKDKNMVVTSKKKGFTRSYDFNMNVAANTTLYGIFVPNRKIFGDKVLAIRHRFDPSIGLGYKPDFGQERWGTWGAYQKPMPNPINPNTMIQEKVYYSKVENSLYGGAGRGKSGNLFFSLDNNLEMKVKNNDSTANAAKTKIVSLIDKFSISNSYNFAADSMRLSNFNASISIKLKDYTLNLSGMFDPYMYGLDKSGNPKRINDMRWNHGKMPRFLGTSLSYDYTLSNKTFRRKEKSREDNDKSSNHLDDETNSAFNEDPNNPNGTNRAVRRNSSKNENKENLDTNSDGYEQNIINWSLTISYTLRYGDGSKFNFEKMEPTREFNHNFSLRGDLKLTPGWSINGGTSYDFAAKQFTYTNFSVTRNLHCWTLSGNFVPFGPYKTYSFRIGVNSSMLSDLKYEKQGGRSGASNVTWY